MTRRLQIFLLALFMCALPAQAAKLGWLEQIPLESFEKMREVERYQLGIAEKHYVAGEYKVALDEYEKFLTLYEASTGAAYAQLMWSHCQLRLRKVNTAIRDGFQSVIDYWPNSREAVLAAYLIPSSYQDMGEVEKAAEKYRELIAAHPDDSIAVLAKVRILAMAKVAGDDETRLQLLEELTYKTGRNDATGSHCRQASRELADYYLRNADWVKSLKALQTSYQDRELDQALHELGRLAVATLHRDEEKRESAGKLAGALVAHFEKGIPTDLADTEDNKGNRDVARSNLGRIADVFGLVGKKAEVLATYQRIGKLLGTDDGLRGQIAGYHRSVGERDEALKIYGSFDNAVNGQRHIASMLREEGKHKEAIEIYRQLVDADPDRIDDYLWAVAECQEAIGDLKSAVQSYRQTDRWPTNYFRMASCQRRLKQHGEALALYNQVKSHDGSAPEAMIQSAYTYEEAGQKENAIKAFQLTCRAHPKSSQASRAHAHLQTKYQITVTLGGAKDE